MFAATPAGGLIAQLPVHEAARVDRHQRFRPSFGLVTHYFARNHVVDGIRVSCKIMPAVTEV
jgi:hypothetical protein